MLSNEIRTRKLLPLNAIITVASDTHLFDKDEASYKYAINQLTNDERSNLGIELGSLATVAERENVLRLVAAFVSIRSVMEFDQELENLLSQQTQSEQLVLFETKPETLVA